MCGCIVITCVVVLYSEKLTTCVVVLYSENVWLYCTVRRLPVWLYYMCGCTVR